MDTFQKGNLEISKGVSSNFARTGDQQFTVFRDFRTLSTSHNSGHKWRHLFAIFSARFDPDGHNK